MCRDGRGQCFMFLQPFLAQVLRTSAAMQESVDVWVGNVPHATPGSALVAVLHGVAGKDFVQPIRTMMKHRGNMQEVWS